MQAISFRALAPKAYDTHILVGVHALKHIPDILNSIQHDRVVILFDRGIQSIADTVARVCQEHDPLLIAVESGDSSKSLTEVDRIVHAMLEARCTRGTILIVVGGGMMTDLGGFVANVFMRGIPSILVPTSALAMVDAAIGGKTAVNSGTKKNMIGSISHPRGVCCDIGLLKDLPEPLLAEGLAEVIKIAAITHADFFTWLEEHIPKVIARDTAALTDCVYRAVQAKLDVIAKDIDDRSTRLFLNFGHTVAHAVEAVSSFAVSHGEAVSIGMNLEMRAANAPDIERVKKLLTHTHLPTEIPHQWKKKDLLWRAMLVDKKSEDGHVRIAIPMKLGQGAMRELTMNRFLEIL